MSTTTARFTRMALSSRLMMAFLFGVGGAFVAGRAAWADDAPSTSAPSTTSGEDTAALRARIHDMVHGMRDVPLPVIIEAISGQKVIPWNGEEREALDAVATTVQTSIDRGGIEASRVNEAGNQVENFVMRALRKNGFTASRPVAASGRVRSSGYPDLQASRGGIDFYVEVKTYSAATVDSSQRSFYLSPSTDFKVTRPARHLLIAVELASGARGVYHALGVRWLDLSRLRCDLKYEFNANNRDLYRSESGLTIIEHRAGDSATNSGSAPVPAPSGP